VAKDDFVRKCQAAGIAISAPLEDAAGGTQQPIGTPVSAPGSALPRGTPGSYTRPS